MNKNVGWLGVIILTGGVMLLSSIGHQRQNQEIRDQQHQINQLQRQLGQVCATMLDEMTDKETHHCHFTELPRGEYSLMCADYSFNRALLLLRATAHSSGWEGEFFREEDSTKPQKFLVRHPPEELLRNWEPRKYKVLP